jgi:cytochrome c553
MAPFAAPLSDDDLGNLAAYYQAQKPAPPAAATDPQRAAAARRLIAADHCDECRGPGLAGDEHIPRLAGQHREYLQRQLSGFKSGRPRRYRRQHDGGARALDERHRSIGRLYLPPWHPVTAAMPQYNP